jgi:long-subunit acyl-CoA synthetase (AMP-forming)
MSGSTCPVEVVNDSAEKLNMKNIVVVYGMTETSPLITASSIHESFENRTQTIGKPMEMLECKVVDEHNRIVSLNTPGQLLVRGYNVMLGYWNDKEKTDDTMTPDRFIKTGFVIPNDLNRLV